MVKFAEVRPQNSPTLGELTKIKSERNTLSREPAVIREVKRRAAANEKPLSQEEAIQVALAGIKAHKDQYTGFGREMHEAFKAFDLAQPLNLPTPKHEAYFQGFLYFRRQHPNAKPILDRETGEPFIEKFISCPHCELSTQIDNFSEVDGLNTIIDYKTGRTIGYAAYQLGIYKHVLEHLGYRVDRTWAVHVQSLFAFPIETNKSWEEVELRLKNAEMKRKELNPKTYIRDFSGEKTAATAEKKEAVIKTGYIGKIVGYDPPTAKRYFEDEQKKEASAEAKTSREQEFAHETNSQGHQSLLEELGLSATDSDSMPEALLRFANTCPGPVDKSLPGISDLLPPTEFPTQKRRRGRPRKIPCANTSLHKVDSLQRTRPEAAEGTIVLSAKNRKVRAVYGSS